jgi:2-dehydro-3-deoxyglucarate aldolase/4-hydroxy-2-oxoheptanedioate aldolase
MVGKFLDYGYSWVAIGSDVGMMVGRAQEYLGKLRGIVPASVPPQSAY